MTSADVLEGNIGVRLDHERSRIMLCGDPAHLAVENDW